MHPEARLGALESMLQDARGNSYYQGGDDECFAALFERTQHSQNGFQSPD